MKDSRGLVHIFLSLYLYTSVHRQYSSHVTSLSFSLSLSHTYTHTHTLTDTHTLYICILVLQYNQFIVLKNNTFVWLCIFINRCRDNRVHVKEGKITLSDIVYICWDWWCSNQHNSLKVILILFCLLLCIWMKIIRTSLIMGFLCIIT